MAQLITDGQRSNGYVLRLGNILAQTHGLAMTHEVTEPEIPSEHAGFLKGPIRPQMSQNYSAAKRLCEIFIVIVVAPPVMITIALLALAILCTVGPPIFVKQDRVGKGGRIFKRLKLRTGFSEHIKPSSREDTRVTLFGRFLEDSCLAELPQLWNVLIGDMSIFGSRQESPHNQPSPREAARL